MKRIISIAIYISVIVFILASCASEIIPTQKINQINALQAKQQIINSFDPYGLMGTGVNDFYRHGYFIYALAKHGILETNDVTNFCVNLERVKQHDGFYRRPDINDYMTRDDYILAALGLDASKRVHPCAKELLDYMYEHRKLEKDIWGFHHNLYFARLVEKPITGKLIDIELFSFAPLICRGPKENTSDKLLFMALLLKANDTDNPSYFAERAINFCRKEVDFNYSVDYYYCGGQLGCKHPLAELLKGIL